MLTALNRLVERRDAGEDVQPDFEQFMAEFGDLVPGNPANLEELLESLARQLAAARELLESSVARSSGPNWPNCPRPCWKTTSTCAWSSNGWRPAWPAGLRGTSCSACPSASGRPALWPASCPTWAVSNNCWRGAPSPGALAEVDIDRARELLGQEDARSLEALGRLARQLRDSGLVEQKGGRLRLTPRGLRRIGEQALSDLYARLAQYRAGQHPVGSPGAGHERAGETKPYEWGDAVQPFDRTDGAQRPGPSGARHSGRAVAGGLRGRADRGSVRARPP